MDTESTGIIMRKSNLTTPIAIAFTPNYFIPVATLLRSILDASTGTFKVICLVTEDIPDRMQEMLMDLDRARLKLEFILLKGRLEGIYIDSRYTEAASFRLLLPEILPEFDDIIYLDCDIIVRQDLNRLYEETVLGKHYLAAVYEAPIEKQADRILQLGCRPDQYFNSGFLILNLSLMRNEKVTARLLDACRVDYLEFPDQDALNKVCQGRVLSLPPMYNGIRTFFLPQYKPEFLKIYSDQDWNLVQKEGNIHYTGGKPWDLITVKFGRWWEKYGRLPKVIKKEWKPKPAIRLLGSIFQFPLVERVIESWRALRSSR